MMRLFIILLLMMSCNADRDSGGSSTPVKKPGYFAFIGSYGSSSYLPLVQYFENESSSLPTVISSSSQFIKNAEAVASVVKAENVTSIFTTGDNNYPHGCQSHIDNNIGRLYREYIGNYSGSYGSGARVNQFFPTLGNHDVLVYEAYLIKNNRPITLGLFEHGETTYRFSRTDWEIRLAEGGGLTSTVAGEFFQHLLDNDKLESKGVSVEDGTTGTSYVPKKAITLDDFTSTQQSTLKTNLTQLMGASSPLGDTAINIILSQIFNLYCILDSDIGPTIPYFNYFTLPGNERYYKVSKKHLDTKVDFFILNITSTFNSETANEQDGVVVGSVQNLWFVRETTNSDADFKIVLVHDEPHGSFESNPVTKSWNLEQYVDVVMSGDVQVYERSLITTDFGEAFFLSVGVGGLLLEDATPQENSASQSIVKEYGALFMQINSGQLDFEFKDKYGKTRDTFTLKSESLRKFVDDR